MADRWKSEGEDLRHSRRHCINQYGTNFVRDELPKLLRDFDGLSEDEIVELTQDGPDLVPPSPALNSANLDGDGWIDAYDYRDDSNGSDEDDDDDVEAGEDDGWETADEG
jgi:hypothetical protein